jgi:hypothetical protein
LFAIENHINSLKEGLQQHSDALIERIKETCKFNYYKETDLLDYTAFVQSSEITLRMFSMDKDANEVFYEGNDSSIFSGSCDLLDEIETYSIPDDKEDEFWEFYEKSDQEISEAETKAIVEWFVECWNKADGKSITLPAYFSFHDYDTCYDLQNDKWITDGDKWDD